MSKFWHIFGSIGLTALAILSPTVHTAIAGNPAIAAILASIWAILGNVLPSPVQLTAVPPKP